MRKNYINLVVALAAIFSLVLPAVVFASSTSDLTQTINAGTLSTSILDATRTTVGSPSATMSAVNFSFSCQTSTGTLGSNSQRLYVTDPSATANGWTLALAATGGATDTWHNTGSTQTYKFNDATGSGCTNGQLTVDPSVATITTDCVSSGCTGATVTKGTSSALTGSTPVTLMTGAAGTNTWRGYLTGAALSQKIPAEQPADSYSINMTLTVTAN